MSTAYASDHSQVLALNHSQDKDGSDKKLAKIIETIGSSLQRRDLTMGGGYQRDITSKLAALSEHPKFISNAERHALSSAVNIELNAEMRLQLDLMQAAGSMVNDLKATILEISSNAENLSSAQKAKFIEVVFNAYQLKQANTGRIELPTSDIEKLAAKTLNTMRELAEDGVLPLSLKTLGVETIKTSATVFQIVAIDAQVEQFEQDTSPTVLLDKALDKLKETLFLLLEQNDLDPDLRKDIEESLEQLNDTKNGDPIPRDTLKLLDAISKQLPESSPFAAQLHALREANIMVKAEKFNLSIEQVRAIEATMDRLEALYEGLPNENNPLKDMIAETITALDKDPVSIKAMAKLEAVTDALQDPKFKAFEQSNPAIASLAAPIVTSSKFVQKFLIEKVAQKFDIPKASVKDFVTLYKTIDSQSREIPKASPLKQILLSTLNSINKTPTSIRTLAKLSLLRETIKSANPKDFLNVKFDQSNFLKLLSAVQTPVISIVKSQLGKKFGLAGDEINKLVKFYKSIDVQSRLIDPQASSLQKIMKATLISLNQNPLSIKTMAKLEGLKKAIDRSLSSSFKSDKIRQTVFKIGFQSTYKGVSDIMQRGVERIYNIPRPLIPSFTAAYTAMETLLSKIPSSNISSYNRVHKTMEALSSAPLKISTAGMIKTIVSMPSSIIPPRMYDRLNKVVNLQTSLIAKAQSLPKNVVKTAIGMVASLTTLGDAIVPKNADIKNTSITQSISNLINKISDTPTSVSNLVKGTEILYGKVMHKLASSGQAIKGPLDLAKTVLDGHSKTITQWVAEKTAQPVQKVQLNIHSMLEGIKKSVGLTNNPTPKFKPETYKPAEGLKLSLDIDNIPAQKPSLFKKFTGVCGDCAGGFCVACKSGISKTIEVKGRRALVSAFSAVTNVFNKPEPTTKLGKKPTHS